MHLQEVDQAVILTRKLSLSGAAARMYSTAGKEKIAMIGSGNFGSALVRILGRNALDKPETFDPKVSMYVHEEMIDGKPLTQIINETNENVKYLKGAKFTPNVVAEPSLEKAVEGATMVCFCLPHQFLKPLMPAIKVTDAVRQPVRGAAGGGWRWRRRWRQWRRPVRCVGRGPSAVTHVHPIIRPRAIAGLRRPGRQGALCHQGHRLR